MDFQNVERVIVKNLPGSWSTDHLRDFVEVVTELEVADNGIQVFKDISHTALVMLEKPVSISFLGGANEKLAQVPFKEHHTLQLEAITGGTHSVLVHYSDPQLLQDHVSLYFDNPVHSGCERAEVTHCEMHSKANVAVVHYSLPEAVQGVISRTHTIKRGGETVRVEPWYERFHRPLLEQLVPRAKPPVPPKPKSARETLHASGAVPKGAASPPIKGDISEVEELRRKVELLELEKRNLKTSEEEKIRKAHTETVMRQRTENEKLRSENEKLKKQITLRIPLPDHQLCLLKEFAARSWEGCKLTLLEGDGEALLHGTEEGCEEVKRELLLYVQSMTEEIVALSDTLAGIFDSTKGRAYLEDLVQRYPKCSAKVQGSSLFLAAFKEEDLQAFKTEFERNILHQICKVPADLVTTAQFQSLKTRLERDFLVAITPSTGGSEDVRLDGLQGDVEMAARDVDSFTSRNRTDSKRFHVAGTVQGMACKKLLSTELEEVKLLITKNGEIEEETTEEGYTLKFRCRQEVLEDVMDRLNAVKESIVPVELDLNKEFPAPYEKALVINGLHSFGIRPFCSQLGDKLKEAGVDSVGDFKLPQKCCLPQIRLRGQGGHKEARGHTEARGHQRRRLHHGKSSSRGDHSGSGGHQSKQLRPYPSLPYSVTVGSTTITVKAGDITAEQVSAAVSVIGKDLNPKATAISSAFLKKCPSIAQAVKELVQQSLQLAVQNGLPSIAFPSLGVGKRFGHGRYTTASAMMAAFKEFLQANPSSLQTIAIVVFDDKVAGKFAQVLNQKLGGGPSTLPTSTDQQAEPAPAAPEAVSHAATSDGDDDSSDTDGSGGNSDTVLEEPEGLRLCGRKDAVQGLLAVVHSKLHLHVKLQHQHGWHRRRTLHLPVDTDRLPSYWKICRKEKHHSVSYEKASEAWHKRGVKLNSISKEERAAVEKLVQGTWQAEKAGAGKDARGLTHNSIQVVKVERLENPSLWQEYSHRREQLFSRLDRHHRGPSTAHCTPVENLANSRGPVQTTANIPKDSPMCREIYPQVNEHYLFHGTKKDVLHKIYREGLDFRVAGKAMLGSGVYSAESSTKADQYTDVKQARTSGEELTMILMRVLLGEPFIHKELNPTRHFTRPPCMACSKTVCKCVGALLFNSIIDDARLFREFVVYDQHVCYPEYFVTYRRTMSA